MSESTSAGFHTIHCDCIATLDAKLAEHNTRICQAFVIGEGSLDLSGALVRTEQKETGRGKKKALWLHSTFCPFCGLKYGEQLATPANSSPPPTQTRRESDI